MAMDPRVTVTPKPEAPRSELGDFLVVARRCMLTLCDYIDRRYGTTQPDILRQPKRDDKRRAA